MEKITLNFDNEKFHPNRTIDVERIEPEEQNEGTLRPSSWDDYIGQDKIKKNLKVFIEASKMRGEALDHILFFGSAGLGKTTLSYIIANEMGAGIKVTAAPMIEKTGDLAALLTNLNDNDILFIDEIHRLSPAIEEVLYPAMEDFRLDIIIGAGAAAQTIKVDLPRFTLLGATTKAGMISMPLRDRFGMHFRLQFYDKKELALIITKAGERLKKDISKEASMEIAKRSRGTPRLALRLLRRVRDFADVNGENEITLERAKIALDELGVNEHGLDELDIKYLNILARARKAVGLSTISASIREDEGTIEDVIEPFLIANSYIERTAKGRVALRKSFDVLNERSDTLL